MDIKNIVKKNIRRVGYDISRFSPELNPLSRRKKLLHSYEIDVILDVGANTGQYALQTRNEIGFSSEIISFEPLSSAFELLKRNADLDPKWKAINCALGEYDAIKEINIAGNSTSSSLLNMLPTHIKAAPESSYVSKEKIKVKALDSIIDRLCQDKDNIYLKLDTQGYESEVLKGASKSLSRIGTIQIEMSLVALYEGQVLFEEMHRLLSEKGYFLVSIEAVLSDRSSGQLLQIDGIYHRF